MNNNYVVATIKEWNISQYEQQKKKLPGTWHLISTPEQLTIEQLRKINPRYVFFPHWSWIVSEEILNEFECVCFHMTDLPFGRGGSPLQNLIQRGYKETQLTALKMNKQLDAGDIYLKHPLNLSGSAADIFLKAAQLTFIMIKQIVTSEPAASPQQGQVVEFKRRTPAQSEIPKNLTIEQIYNHIRMLDAESYPKAFIDYGDFRIEFKNASINEQQTLTAQIILSPKKQIEK
ncbi:formyltransferase family protein [Psychromonas ossibalaenae]|uniref:formyltransferase family protein n=1 Tax=Psychromonas ossibalaenae TaxID=444922 RepID=UPI00036EC15B|nr:formyltransferase family protein [Psychromonas ossibalaenae]